MATQVRIEEEDAIEAPARGCCLALMVLVVLILLAAIVARCIAGW